MQRRLRIMKHIKRLLSIIVMMAVALTFFPLINGQVYAAAKKPAAPKITSVKEATTAADDYKLVDVSWGKAKNAKMYELAIRSTDKQWVKVKTVKKNAKNKKKYTKKNKYRVVAKGKKYAVYKYEYKYWKSGTTKSCRYRFNEGPNWEDLHPNTTYVFAVRSVNGKKRSAWRTASLTTSAASVESRTITSPGESQSLTVNGNTVTATIGQQCTLPVPAPRRGSLEVSSFTIVPEKIEYILMRGNDGNDEEISVSGKTPAGAAAYYKIETTGGICDNVRYSYGDCGEYSVEGLGYGPGYIGKKYTVSDSDVTVEWALDGTEPQLGQEGRTMNGNEYPFDQVTSNGAAYNGSLRVRGTASYNGGSSSLWGELGRALFNKCEWIKIFRGNTVVEESFYYEGFYNY